MNSFKTFSEFRSVLVSLSERVRSLELPEPLAVPFYLQCLSQHLKSFQPPPASITSSFYHIYGIPVYRLVAKINESIKIDLTIVHFFTEGRCNDKLEAALAIPVKGTDNLLFRDVFNEAVKKWWENEEAEKSEKSEESEDNEKNEGIAVCVAKTTRFSIYQNLLG